MEEDDVNVRYVARRCEYLARCRGDLLTAADIRREFNLDPANDEEIVQIQQAGYELGRHGLLPALIPAVTTD